MNNNFTSARYAFIPNFITPDQAAQCARELREAPTSPASDWDVAPNASYVSDPTFGLEIMCDKNQLMNDIVGEYLIPTYCFSRIYRTDDTLPEHTDRAACEVSLTIHLDGDTDWLFGCFDNELQLNPGDAVLYLGHIVPHYRVGPYKGKEYLQLFLHYVRSRGCHRSTYFDKIDMEVNKQKLMEELYGI
tara:strand:+ start:141 stop:707 length:567 start_codon:yes stop_codon:yes gene_type:complete